jgi:predicted transcriptional regulator
VEDLSDIRRRRLALGIPVRELARAVGRSVATVSRIERGRIRPSYELAQGLFSYLEAREGEATPDLQARDVMNTQVVTLDENSTLGAAASLMEQKGYSQFPVVDGGRVTGSLSDVALLRALADPRRRRERVRSIQEPAYPQVGEEFPADLLASLLGRYPAVLIVERGEIRGIVTKMDLIRGLRLTTLRRRASSASPT